MRVEYIQLTILLSKFLATSPCVLALVYTQDSLLLKDIKRLWPIHAVQTLNMPYAFEVQVYGEILYLEVFSEPFILR